MTVWRICSKIILENDVGKLFPGMCRFKTNDNAVIFIRKFSETEERFDLLKEYHISMLI